VKRNDIFIVKIWRNEFNKINTRLHHTARQAPAHPNDFKDINRFLSQKVSHASVHEGDNTNECENHLNQEIKCAACGSTNLIKISDYSKAILFLGNISDDPEREKIRTSNRMAKGNKFPTMWWCLHCKRLC
jgi:hypothetical protein